MRRAIMAKCQQYLIRWSVPKEIEFVDELPYTMLGKVDFVKIQKEEDAKRGL
jgi:acyl-CoA synthetase (AMP-forming)/AMP-acid ligase II